MGNLFFVAPIGVHGVDFGGAAIGGEAPPDNFRAVGGEERPAVIAGRIGQAAHIGAVRVHDVNVHEGRLVPLEQSLLFRRQLAAIGGAVGSEQDSPSVRRIGALGVIARRFRQIFVGAAGHVHFINIVGVIEIPAIAAMLAGLARLLLRLHFGAGLRVFVSGGEQRPVLQRMQPAACGLANAGRNAVDGAAVQIKQIHLIEGIVEGPLRLENHPAAIGGEIALAGALADNGQLADVGQQRLLAGEPDGFGLRLRFPARFFARFSSCLLCRPACALIACALVACAFVRWPENSLRCGLPVARHIRLPGPRP